MAPCAPAAMAEEQTASPGRPPLLFIPPPAALQPPGAAGLPEGLSLLAGPGSEQGLCHPKELRPPAMPPPWGAGLSAATAATRGAGLETLVLAGLRPDPPFSGALVAHGISVIP